MVRLFPRGAGPGALLAASGALLAVLLAASLAASLAGLAGCSDSPEVASLSAPATAAAPDAAAAAPAAGDGPAAPLSGDAAVIAAHHQSADQFRACLNEAGIETADSPIYLDGWDVEFTSVDPLPVNREFWYNIPGGDNMAWETFDPDMVDAAIAAGEWVFVDGEVDRSADLRRCADESGYFIPEPRADPREEELVKGRIADASNEWADCARANGHPGLVDAVVTVDNWQTDPAVALPSTMTVAELESLLRACPYVNPVVLDKTAEELAAMDPPPAEPLVKFDLPTGDRTGDALDAALRASRVANTPAF
ncbi:MAG: hypothetical protein LBG60_03770 [Bifidobacteriaceae bacterium]|jgi:hypothetical protein|nr:hypothetical protein [Bifidobacteriaceae bacterium]